MAEVTKDFPPPAASSEDFISLEKFKRHEKDCITSARNVGLIPIANTKQNTDRVQGALVQIPLLLTSKP